MFHSELGLSLSKSNSLYSFYNPFYISNIGSLWAELKHVILQSVLRLFQDLKILDYFGFLELVHSYHNFLWQNIFPVWAEGALGKYFTL